MNDDNSFLLNKIQLFYLVSTIVHFVVEFVYICGGCFQPINLIFLFLLQTSVSISGFKKHNWSAFNYDPWQAMVASFFTNLVFKMSFMSGMAWDVFSSTKRTSINSLARLKPLFAMTVSSCGVWPCRLARRSRVDSWYLKWVSLSYRQQVFIPTRHYTSWFHLLPLVWIFFLWVRKTVAILQCILRWRVICRDNTRYLSVWLLN